MTLDTHQSNIVYCIAGNVCQGKILPKADAEYCGKNSPDLFSRTSIGFDFFSRAVKLEYHGREPAWIIGSEDRLGLPPFLPSVYR